MGSYNIQNDLEKYILWLEISDLIIIFLRRQIATENKCNEENTEKTHHFYYIIYYQHVNKKQRLKTLLKGRKGKLNVPDEKLQITAHD